jgi:hypothetical protein
MKSIFLQPVNECKKAIEVRLTDDFNAFYSDGSRYIVDCIVHTGLSRIDKIYETDLELPLLEEGDKFYIVDIEKEVKINKRMRSSDGSITYEVDARDEVVDSEYDITELLNFLNKINKKISNFVSLVTEVRRRWNGKSILKDAGID